MMTSGYISLVFLLAFATLVLAGPLPPPQDADPNSTDVRDSAAFAVESFNYFSKEENLYKIVKIVKVQEEIVGGAKYMMEVNLGLTRCLKEEDRNVESCPLMADQPKMLQCNFVVLTVPWRNERRLLQSSCMPKN
ncbi:CYTC protein, partial [Polypterus senegalus]